MFPFMMQNMHSSAIKKYLFEILQGRYQKNERFIDRLSSMIVTKEDYESLGALVADLYETGFLKAVDEYRGQMTKMGLNVSVVAEQKPAKGGKPIFQSEKSG
jgi:hypothetical protein